MANRSCANQVSLRRDRFGLLYLRLDLESREAVQHRDERIDEVEKTEGKVGEGRYAERCSHVNATRIPGDERRGDGAGVFEHPGKIFFMEAALNVGVFEHASRLFDLNFEYLVSPTKPPNKIIAVIQNHDSTFQ